MAGKVQAHGDGAAFAGRLPVSDLPSSRRRPVLHDGPETTVRAPGQALPVLHAEDVGGSVPLPLLRQGGHGDGGQGDGAASCGGLGVLQHRGVVILPGEGLGVADCERPGLQVDVLPHEPQDLRAPESAGQGQQAEEIGPGAVGGGQQRPALRRGQGLLFLCCRPTGLIVAGDGGAQQQAVLRRGAQDTPDDLEALVLGGLAVLADGAQEELDVQRLDVPKLPVSEEGDHVGVKVGVHGRQAVLPDLPHLICLAPGLRVLPEGRGIADIHAHAQIHPGLGHLIRQLLPAAPGEIDPLPGMGRDVGSIASFIRFRGHIVKSSLQSLTR